MQHIEERKQFAKEVREQKKKKMEENKGLVQEINNLMANDEKAKKRQEELTQEF